MRRLSSSLNKNASGPLRRKRSFLRRIGVLGFTILELFIVIEIIGFLTTIVLSNFYKSKKAAQVAVTIQNIKNIQVALTSHFAIEGQYPSTVNTIWLNFYHGKVIEDVEYIGGATALNHGGWDFFSSHSPDVRVVGIPSDGYAIRSKANLLPYATYIYGDMATSARIVH